MSYRTGEAPVVGATLALAWAAAHVRAAGERTAIEALHWLVTPWANDGDYLGALLGLLMLRHRHPSGQILLFPLINLAAKTKLGPTGSPDPSALLARLDEVLGDIRALAEPTEANK